MDPCERLFAAVTNLGSVASLMKRRTLKMRQHSIKYSTRVVIKPAKASSVWFSFRGLQLILLLTGTKRVIPSGWRRLRLLLLIRKKIAQNVSRHDNHLMHFLISACFPPVDFYSRINHWGTFNSSCSHLTFSFFFLFFFFLPLRLAKWPSKATAVKLKVARFSSSPARLTHHLNRGLG